MYEALLAPQGGQSVAPVLGRVLLTARADETGREHLENAGHHLLAAQARAFEIAIHGGAPQLPATLCFVSREGLALRGDESKPRLGTAHWANTGSLELLQQRHSPSPNAQSSTIPAFSAITTASTCEFTPIFR